MKKSIRRFASVMVHDEHVADLLSLPCPFKGIVEGSYWDIYHHRGSKTSYSVHCYGKDNKKLINTISWVEQANLVVIDDSPHAIIKNMDIVRKYC